MNRPKWNGNEPDVVKRIDKRIREELTRTAEPLPASYDRRVREILEHLPDKNKCKKERQGEQRWASWKAAAVILVSVLFVSTGVTAGVKLYRQRLASMEPGKVEELNFATQKQQISADLYSRDLSEEEDERLTELRERYENEGLFPEAELRCVNAEEDVTPGELCYCYENGTFYLPEQEMSEEELLQILDFRYKRNYSLEKIREGEEKAVDAIEDEGVDASGTENGEMAVEKSLKLVKDLYGWDTEGADSDVTTDGEYYNVTLKKSGWAYDVELEIDIDTMELSSLSVGDEKQEIWKNRSKIDEKQYREYGEKVWEMGKILVSEEQMKQLSFGYYYEKNKGNIDGIVHYYLMCIDGGGYIFSYSLNMQMICGISRVSDVKRQIRAAGEFEGYEYKVKKVY